MKTNRTSEALEELRVKFSNVLPCIQSIAERYEHMERTLAYGHECPWPESIFTPLTDEERMAILEAIDKSGVRNPRDRIFAHWGRRVWETFKLKNQEALEFDPLEDREE